MTSCGASADCAEGLRCAAGRCVSELGGVCVETTDCLAGAVCEGGQCLGTGGSVCGAQTPCASTFVCEEETCRSNIAKAGTEIRELTDEQRSKWVETMKPVWDKFKDDIGQDLIDAAQAASHT